LGPDNQSSCTSTSISFAAKDNGAATVGVLLMDMIGMKTTNYTEQQDGIILGEEDLMGGGGQSHH
jgi:uncharacterized protein YaiE (UPF0345 family)